MNLKHKMPTLWHDIDAIKKKLEQRGNMDMTEE